jgi:hypothetical protein
MMALVDTNCSNITRDSEGYHASLPRLSAAINVRARRRTICFTVFSPSEAEFARAQVPRRPPIAGLRRQRKTRGGTFGQNSIKDGDHRSRQV